MTDRLPGVGAEVPLPLKATLGEVIEKKDNIELLRLVQEEHPAEIAEALDSLELEALVPAFRTILLSDVSVCAEILIEMDPSTISQLYPYLSIQEWSWLFNEHSDDDAVYILELFPEEARTRLVARMPVKDKEDVLELMTYPEDTAGRIMTNEYLAMDEEATVAQAIERVRKAKEIDPTNLFFIYVTKENRLVGMVSLRKLLLHDQKTKLKKIMRTDVSPIDVHLDQEEVAEIVSKRDEVSVPVVNKEGHVLGIITVDDVIDVINEESEEDLYRQIGSSDQELLAGDNTRKIVVLRLPWIMASFFGSFLVALIMKFTERDIFGDAAAQVFVFVPMICAMGGNVGVQSSTIMARFLSTANVDWSEARRTTFKEAKVGLSLGLVCGLLIGGISYFWGGLGMTVTVLAAMVCAMTTAAATGTVIPIAMKKLGFDPALATGPFVTSFNDFVATCVYFTIAFLFLDQWMI